MSVRNRKGNKHTEVWRKVKKKKRNGLSRRRKKTKKEWEIEWKEKHLLNSPAACLMSLLSQMSKVPSTLRQNEGAIVPWRFSIDLMAISGFPEHNLSLMETNKDNNTRYLLKFCSVIRKTMTSSEEKRRNNEIIMGKDNEIIIIREGV